MLRRLRKNRQRNQVDALARAERHKQRQINRERRRERRRELFRRAGKLFADMAGVFFGTKWIGVGITLAIILAGAAIAWRLLNQP